MGGVLNPMANVPLRYTKKIKLKADIRVMQLQGKDAKDG